MGLFTKVAHEIEKGLGIAPKKHHKKKAAKKAHHHKAKRNGKGRFTKR